MSRRAVALTLPVLVLFALAARKPDHPKHENHYKAVNTPKIDGLDMTVNGAESQREFVRLDVKYTNTTSDRLFVVKKDESEFNVPGIGTVRVKAPVLFGGALLIAPGESRTNVWMADGRDQFHTDTMSFQAKGVSSGPNTGTPVAVPDFQVPPARNDFTAGPFSCNVTATNSKTDASVTDIACVYNGTGVGFIDARKISAKSKSGTEYANKVKNAKRDVVLPGEKGKFTTVIEIPASDADMQFVPYHLVFRDTFSEASMTPVTVEEWKFELDPAKTADRNK